MLTFTFAGDESGDVSFNFSKGASRYFVATVIATQFPDKAVLSEAFKAMSGLDFYLYFVSELICQIPDQKRAGGTLILDEFGYPDQTKDELRRIMKARNINHKFSRISIRRSQSEPLIQIADLIAGAIWRRDTHNDSGAFDVIERKIRKLVEYAG